MDKIKDKLIGKILSDVSHCLESIYSNKLKDIILIGSHARGDSTDGSDIDILILLEDMDDPISEMENYFDAIWELDLKYDTLISIIPLKDEDYKNRNTPLILNARKEGFSLLKT
jgi:uncharacterized protein